MKLSQMQAETLMQLGNPDTVDGVVDFGVLNELMSLGLVYWRKDHNLEITALGEQVYDELVATKRP